MCDPAIPSEKGSAGRANTAEKRAKIAVGGDAAKIMAKPALDLPKLSREELERMKRRLTIAPSKTSDELRPMSCLDSFCQRSQEVIRMAGDETISGLLNVSATIDEERRKSTGAVFPTLEDMKSPSSAVSWRDELKALKEELALPGSVSLVISGMGKANDNNSEHNEGNSEVAQNVEALNTVVTPPSPPPALLKDIDLDFLSTFGSGQIDQNLVRQSVMLSFDPVVERALKEPNPPANPSDEGRTAHIARNIVPAQQTSSSQSEEMSEGERRITAVQKKISDNRKRDLKELDELIWKLLQELDELENRPTAVESAVLSTSEETELLMQLDEEIPRLEAELAEPPIEIEQIIEEIDELDLLIEQLKGDAIAAEAEQKELLEQKTQDLNSHKEHLEYMEEVFDNLYQNYMKAKESRKGLIHNKNVLEKHNQYLKQVEEEYKKNFEKIKTEHELAITRAKKELASKEAEIRELKKKRSEQSIHSY